MGDGRSFSPARPVGADLAAYHPLWYVRGIAREAAMEAFRIRRVADAVRSYRHGASEPLTRRCPHYRA